jgi:hypothetical protein
MIATFKQISFPKKTRSFEQKLSSGILKKEFLKKGFKNSYHKPLIQK